MAIPQGRMADPVAVAKTSEIAEGQCKQVVVDGKRVNGHADVNKDMAFNTFLGRLGLQRVVPGV